MENKLITVTWFNSRKGFGEGVDSEGQTIFLVAHAIKNKGMFKNLNCGEKIKVVVKKDNLGNPYSYSILKGKKDNGK